MFADQHTFDVPSVPARHLSIDIENIECHSCRAQNISSVENPRLRQHARIPTALLVYESHQLRLPHRDESRYSPLRGDNLGLYHVTMRRPHRATSENTEQQEHAAFSQSTDRNTSLRVGQGRLWV
jgi:hypothetical protein